MKRLILLCSLLASCLSLPIIAAEKQQEKEGKKAQINNITHRYNCAAHTAGTILGLISCAPLEDLQNFKKLYNEQNTASIQNTSISVLSFGAFCKDIKDLFSIHKQDMTTPLDIKDIIWTTALATYFITAWYVKKPIAHAFKNNFGLTALNHKDNILNLPVITIKALEKWLKPILVRYFAYYGIRSIGYLHTMQV